VGGGITGHFAQLALTEIAKAGHIEKMASTAGSVGTWASASPNGPGRESGEIDVPPVPAFEQIYDDNCTFIWRSLRGLGVPDANIDDAVQEVFLVVHRRLPEYEPRAHIRSWLFGIAMRVAKDHRRSARRKPTVPLADDPILVAQDSPFEQVARNQALAFVERFLDTLSDEQRALFVLTELEQLRVPEAAELLGENLNTVYSRQRALRKQFAEALAQNPEIGNEVSGGLDG
jgi:RNA polymerase sigma-70 factor (ECF subfamily)